MMLSFVPKLDLSHVVASAHDKPFQRFIHRCFVQLDPSTTSVGDIIRTATSKLSGHLQLRSAYRGEPNSPFRILSVWVVKDVPIEVAVPLSSDVFLLSDAVIARTGEVGFGAAMSTEDGLRFMVLPSYVSIRMLMSMSLNERQRTFTSSPYMQSVLNHHIFLDLPSSELYVEIDFD